MIRRILKLQNENNKNEEKVQELNAQITLMQFKGPSQNPSSGVNIQVFNAPEFIMFWGAPTIGFSFEVMID